MKELAVLKKIKRQYLSYLSIGLLYFFLTAGGLWHILGVFQPAMRILATPIIIGLTAWIIIAYQQKLSQTELTNPRIHLSGETAFFAQSKVRFYFWVLLVLVGSFGIEWLGVQTGIIFGNYTYGTTLQPLLFNVPIAIGFAWLGILLSSIAVIQYFWLNFSRFHFLLKGIFIAAVMVIFDGVMEPAAMKLNYWNWEANRIPIQNFVSWFLISFIFAFIGFRMQLFKRNLPKIAFHAFWAQLIYFGMSGLS